LQSKPTEKNREKLETDSVPVFVVPVFVFFPGVDGKTHGSAVGFTGDCAIYSRLFMAG
jgi:hypothetical protein